jgi:hypothetical protein
MVFEVQRTKNAEKSIQTNNYRFSGLIIVIIICSILVWACGIASVLYLYTPEESSDSIVGGQVVGCIYPGSDYVDELTTAKVEESIRGFDIYYSFFPDELTTDPYLNALTENNITNAAKGGTYPISISGQQYWRLFKDTEPSSTSIEPFHFLSLARRTQDFNLVVDIGNNIFYETIDISDINPEPGTESAVNRFIKLSSTATERSLTEFELYEDEEDVAGFKQKYPGPSSIVQVYFYFFIWGIDENFAKVYCNKPLRVGPVTKFTN